METYQVELLKSIFLIVARCMIVSNFVADGIDCIKNCRIKATELNLTWNCGMDLAELYLLLLGIAQLIASILVVAQKEKILSTGMLFMAAHLRLATNPLLWTFLMYLEVLGVASALFVTMLDPCCEVVIAFLAVIYLNCHDYECPLWNLVYKYIIKLLVTLVLVGYRLKVSVTLLILIITIHCWDAYAFWREPFAQENFELRDRKLFHFWNKVTVMGGLLISALRSQYRFDIF